MAQLVTRGRVAALTVLCTLWSLRAAGQQRDTTARLVDSLKVYTLPPAVVSVTRAFARGGWVEVEETHSSRYLVSDAANTSTSPWWTTNVRVGWDGTMGSLRLHPFVGFNNVWNRFYVASVVINAANGRYYEPAPARNMYVGFSLGAGE